MPKPKTKNAYAKFSTEGIGDALLTVEGWLEYHNKTVEAKQASDLFDVVWKMMEKPLPAPLQKQREAHSLADQWIAEMQGAGFTYDDMLACIKETRRKYEDFKKRKEATHGTQHSSND